MENPSHYPHPGHDAGNQPTVGSRNLPNANLILVLGILSILLCWWHFVSIAGIILGVTTLLLAQREKKLYYSNPAAFSTGSYNNVRTGKTCAIIGLSISLIIFTFVILLLFGILVTLPFWGMMH